MSNLTARDKRPGTKEKNMTTDQNLFIGAFGLGFMAATLMDVFLFRGGRAQRDRCNRSASVSGSASDAVDANTMVESAKCPKCGHKIRLDVAEVNRELLPRAVQLPVSEPAEPSTKWVGHTHYTNWKMLPPDAQAYAIGWMTGNLDMECVGFTYRRADQDKAMYALKIFGQSIAAAIEDMRKRQHNRGSDGDTPQWVASGGS